MLLYCLTPGCFAVDSTRLWLPTNYSQEFSKLHDAAQLVEASERCTVLLRGELQQDRSKVHHPFFKLICRDPTGQTYAEIVDGLTMEMIELPRPKTAEQLAKPEVDKMWSECQQKLQDKTKRFIDLEWLTQDMPEASVQEDETIVISFIIDFNAKDYKGQILKYRALCRYQFEQGIRAQIRPRREL